jgi:hypothetical protein
MNKYRFAARTRVILGSSLAIGMLLFPSLSSGQTAGSVPTPKKPPKSVPPAQGTAGRLRTAPPVGPGPGQRAEGRQLNARPGGSQGDQRGDRTKPPGGQSAVDRRSGGGTAQLLQGGFDLRVVSWEEGSGVPKSGKKLIIVGIDNYGLLHIRIFDAGGKSVMDTDETRLSDAQAVAIASIKRQLPGLLAPHVLNGAEKGRVIRKVTLIFAQTSQDPQRQLHQARPRQLPKTSRTIRSKSGRDAGSSPNPGRSTEKDAG